MSNKAKLLIAGGGARLSADQSEAGCQMAVVGLLKISDMLIPECGVSGVMNALLGAYAHIAFHSNVSQANAQRVIDYHAARIATLYAMYQADARGEPANQN